MHLGVCRFIDRWFARDVDGATAIGAEAAREGREHQRVFAAIASFGLGMSVAARASIRSVMTAAGEYLANGVSRSAMIFPLGKEYVRPWNCQSIGGWSLLSDYNHAPVISPE
jgi:hypothetical protein